MLQDRDEITRQLACSISNDDFDEKSSKPPQSTEKDSSGGSRTTKSWVWTSNTVDAEYGTPTRHRRQTDDTSFPSSTESTKDFSTSARTNGAVTTSKPLALTTKRQEILKTTSNVHDVTLESSIAATSEILEKTETSTIDAIIGATGNKLKGQAETFTTSTAQADFKSGELQREYPSAINQGQLFSIIENGNCHILTIVLMCTLVLIFRLNVKNKEFKIHFADSFIN